jgi:hypothetical protein
MRDKSIALVVVIAVVAVGAFVVNKSSQVKRPSENPANFPPNVLSPEAKRILETGERFVLLAVDPLSVEVPPPPPVQEGMESPVREKFHRFDVLGKIEIQDQKERANLLHALYKGMDGTDGFAPCFYPRHGISATRGNDTVDLVICFQCGIVEVYTNHGDDALAVSKSPEPAFNRALTMGLSKAHLQ